MATIKQGFLASFLCGMFLLLGNIGCSNAHSNKSENGNEIKMDSIIYKDSIFDKNKSKIIVSSDVTFPQLLPNSENSAKLNELFAENILRQDIGDSIDMRTAIERFTATILDSYRMPKSDIDPSEIDANASDVMEYEIATKIKPKYVSKNIICFRKISVVKKDKKQTMETNYHYSINLHSLSMINITDIFDDEAMDFANALIKSRLLEQENATTTSQLIDLGYFNLDNLSVNNNFFFTDKSIVFNYEPYEIACFAIGEVQIGLYYSEIQEFAKPDFLELINH